MNRADIQDFLNLAGIDGVALTNRRMRPCFYGLDSVLERTKQALGQGVLHVLENVPEGFEAFEFSFSENTVFIYKLSHGLVLLVLTGKDLDLERYKKAITSIKKLVETDAYNTISAFKLLLGGATQATATSQNNFGTQLTGLPVNQLVKAAIPVELVSEPAKKSQAHVMPPQPSKVNTKPSITPAPKPQASLLDAAIVETHIKSVSTKNSAQEYKLDELILVMNKLSRFTTDYLGKMVVANYWRSSRPAIAWLAEVEIDRNAQISHPRQKAIACNSEQHHQIQEWTRAFIKRCRQVIRNFDVMLKQDCLDAQQQDLLLGEDPK
ncbi:hypothetical protein V2H45_22010 [Tumidithrix elongata RA019]|uniref:Uncharacterized protein n=1 Tax=Tumidithrix elongata BACA0141 TaxID=2716417 RepID=A0AAW9PW68_9CYAN|nr:hypothetical protein [Tumidithrix elongata RA019]